MKKYISNIIILFLFPILAYTQIDSTYIKSYTDKYTIQVSSEQKYIYLQDHLKKEYNKTFIPNNPINLGLGLSIKNTILSFSYGYGFNFLRDNSKGKTKSFDFQYHYYGRKFTIDTYIQNYKGFYIQDNNRNKMIALAPDLHMKYYSIFSQYVFNGNKFSYKAAVNQNEKQIKSVGSLLLGGGLYYTKIKSDSSFFYKKKNDLKSVQIGFNIGYAYTWVINPKIYISGSLTGGLSIGNTYEKNTINIFSSIQPRFFTGYIKNKWSLILAMQATMNIPMEPRNERQILTLSGAAQLKYIHRLNYFPILSKIFK